MNKKQKKASILAGTALMLLALTGFLWQRYAANRELEGLASGNGRIEAVEIDVAAKIPGRVREVLVREGELVQAGQVVARMDTSSLEAQLRQAEAELKRARSAVATARSQLAQRESERAAAQAAVEQREAELHLARQHAARSSALAAEGAASRQQAEDDRARVQTASAALSAARAQVAAADAAIATTRAQVAGAEAAVDAARASVQRIQADIADSILRTPRDGRVQYLVARAGEVVAAGAPMLNLIDLSDVYMTFFLPTAQAGRLALGTEVRLVLDAAPEYVIPARVSFVSDVAQFTPKTVETRSEREKLMFRVRAQIPPELLRQYIAYVKTGLPGVAYVLLDQEAECCR